MQILTGLAALAIYTAVLLDMKKNMENGEKEHVESEEKENAETGDRHRKAGAH